MLARLASIFTIFSLVFISFIYAPTILAEDPPTSDTPKLDGLTSGTGGLEAQLKDFCNKRSGNQMNLETWYSGKCTDDTFSGEGVGFSDIVILDLAEKLSGKKDPNNTFGSTLKKLILETNKKGADATPLEKQQLYAQARQELFSQNSNGLVGDITKAIGMVFQTPPASTRSYIAYISKNLQKHQVIPTAFAATTGTGFDTFSGLIPLWTAMRNIAYLALVVFFIVYGFMMMFRVNLGQKTVITVQLAIPKLVVTLLIITFSYAIVGLVIDFMWVLIYFIYSFLVSQGILYGEGIFTSWAYGNKGLIPSFIVNFVASLPASSIGITQLVVGDSSIAGITAGVVGFMSGFGIIIAIILMIAIVISYAKLFWALLQALISIVISLITGPIVLLGNAFPGSSAIGTWFRSIIANAFVFPITMLFLLLSFVFMSQPILSFCSELDGFLNLNKITTTCEGIIGVHNLSTSENNVNFPIISPILGGGFSTSAFLAIIGIGLLLMASKYVDIVKNALKVPPFKYGTDIGNALKSGWKGVGSVPSVGDSNWYKNISNVGGLPQGKPITTSKQPKTTELNSQTTERS